MIFSQSKLLNKFSNLTHCFTTKENGNIAFHVNDDIKNVLSNHKRLSYTLNYNKDSLVYMKQIHSNIVHTVTSNDDFKNPQECDALITDRLNTPLMVMVADCSPILFYDNIQKVIAVAHAGRAGAFKNIVKNTLNKFTKEFDSNIKDIIVVVGANIKSCCYEIGVEVFIEAKGLNLEYSIDKKENSYYLDIDKIIKQQLLDLGINEKNIEFIDECTKCNSDKYYSYRTNAKCGRFSGIVKLNP